MNFKDLKYIAAYLIPVLAFLGIYYSSFWSFSTFLFAFFVIPFLELFIKPDSKNLSEKEAKIKESNLLFDLLLYLNIPIVFGLLFFYLESLATGNYTIGESLGITLGIGIVLGSNGINVAHEIGHRDSKFQKGLSKLLLMPTLYMHFIIEHNLGHHKNVGTPEDAATARYNENLFSFWFRSVKQAYKNAWRIENRRLRNEGHPAFSVRNEMIWFLIIQLSFIALILWIYGWIVFGFYMYAAIMGFLLLETINYIEHYGLLRAKNQNGRYERVEHFHSWNSNHELGRIFLYELTRHSDHHFKANKKYQVLKSYEDSPQLPFGYPGSMFIAFIPPLWFSIMNKRVPSSMKLQLNDETS
jgi:alkane 1-monooxygenase